MTNTMNRIAEIIEARGIKELKPANAFLEDLGIKMNTWNKWVKNEQDPDLVQLYKIADFLNCDVCELLKNPSG